MANFAYDIGDEIGEFEVVSRSENSLNGELQYTIISKAHADARRAAEAQAEADLQERLALDGEAPTPLVAGEPDPAPAEVAAPAAASEEPETLQPKS